MSGNERQKRRLPDGVSVYAISSADCLGKSREIEGHLIVELPDGSMHRLTGAEMTEWNEALAPYVKRWRLPD